MAGSKHRFYRLRLFFSSQTSRFSQTLHHCLNCASLFFLLLRTATFLFAGWLGLDVGPSLSVPDCKRLIFFLFIRVQIPNPRSGSRRRPRPGSSRSRTVSKSQFSILLLFFFKQTSPLFVSCFFFKTMPKIARLPIFCLPYKLRAMRTYVWPMVLLKKVSKTC
jgi:hypothetical protein